MSNNTEIALAITGIVLVNSAKDIFWAYWTNMEKRLLVPQLRFSAKFVPAMLAVTWAMRALMP